MPKTLRQEVRQLKRRSARWQLRKVMVEGEKCIRELCQSEWTVERIYFTPSWKESIVWDSLPAEEVVPRMEVSAKDMEMMTALKTSPGLLAVAHLPDSFNELPDARGLTLYLDHVADPGNVGTLIRVADWFGLNAVILSKQSADPLGPKALQSAMGSTFHLPVVVCDLEDLPESLRAITVGLDAGGDNLFVAGNVPFPSLLVVGSESHGLSDSARQACHSIGSIPGSGRAESLNASVAGAIAVATFLQQRPS